MTCTNMTRETRLFSKGWAWSTASREGKRKQAPWNCQPQSYILLSRVSQLSPLSKGISFSWYSRSCWNSDRTSGYLFREKSGSNEFCSWNISKTLPSRHRACYLFLAPIGWLRTCNHSGLKVQTMCATFWLNMSFLAWYPRSSLLSLSWQRVPDSNYSISLGPIWTHSMGYSKSKNNIHSNTLEQS